MRPKLFAKDKAAGQREGAKAGRAFPTAMLNVRRYLPD